MLNKLIESITELNKDINYWFIRTDSGLYFDTYYDNDFIGIGWNYITVEDLRTKTDVEIKEKIAKHEQLDISINKSKGKVTAIYNKLKRFENLAKGDIIIIPSESSIKYAFGIIEDSNIYVDSDQSNNCEYYKRKKVKWIQKSYVDDLDPIFYKIKVSRHAISDINKYASYIDSVTENLYRKGDYSYFVLDINTKDDINVKSLTTLIDTIQNLLVDINDEFNLGEEPDETTIKLNLQSPGKVIFKLKKGVSLIMLAVLLSIESGCSPTQGNVTTTEQTKITNFKKVKQKELDTVNKEFNELHVGKIKDIN